MRKNKKQKLENLVSKSPHDIFMDSLKGLKFRYKGEKDVRLSPEHNYNLSEIIYNNATGEIGAMLIEDLTDKDSFLCISPESFMYNFYTLK